MIKAILVLAIAVGTASALPAGFATFFQGPCPSGWTEVPDAKGRVVVSVTDYSQSGLTVGTAFLPEQDIEHTHTFSGSFHLPSKNIAAISCCDNAGADNGDNDFSGTTQGSTSGLPYTQETLCALLAENDTYVVPFGSAAFFTVPATSCPAGWNPFTAAEGRSIMGGYISSGGVPEPSIDPPLQSQEDRRHTHTFVSTVTVPDISFAGVDGCCNDAPAPAGGFPVSGETDPASANIPYIQLLTCISNDASFNVSLPPSALLFSTLVGCDDLDGWVLAEDMAGRFLVALPDGGIPGASFGGLSLAPNATAESGTAHILSATFPLKSDSVGLIVGCCADGYAQATDVSFNALSTPNSPQFPYLQVPLCMQQ